METQRESVAEGLRDAEKRLREAYLKQDAAEMKLQRDRLEYLEELALRLISQPATTAAPEAPGRCLPRDARSRLT